MGIADLCLSAGPSGAGASFDMGLAPGGKMDQEIYEDWRKLKDWDTDHGSRCFVHLANSLAWRAITGDDPPTVPFTSKEYADHGMPWFNYYGADKKALSGAPVFQGVKSVVQKGEKKGEKPLPENESVEPGEIIQLGKKLAPNQVREGSF